MTGTGQTIAVSATFRKSNKNPLELRASAYRSGKKRNTLYTEHFRVSDVNQGNRD
jgi:hypothetical protein